MIEDQSLFTCINCGEKFPDKYNRSPKLKLTVKYCSRVCLRKYTYKRLANSNKKKSVFYNISDEEKNNIRSDRSEGWGLRELHNKYKYSITMIYRIVGKNKK